MAKKTQSFSVMALGLKPAETRVLKALLSVKSKQAWQYQMVEPDATGSNVDIVLLDQTDPRASDHYRDKVSPSNPQAVTINITSDTSAAASDPLCNFCRPIRMQQLIKGLDAVVISRLHYVPPISDDMAIDASLVVEGGSELKKDKFLVGHSALVLDDSPTVCMMMESVLSALGLEAVTVERYNEAADLLHARRFDLIFLDVVLEDSPDGYKLCKKIKADAESKNTPIVMLTSKGSTIDKVRGKLAGADAYLTKPVDQKELVATINRLIKQSFLNKLNMNV